MSRAFSALPILLAAAVLTGQPAPRPTLAEVRAAMGLPSAGALRGQQEIKERGKETLEDGKSRLKRAIDAGVDAFKEEKEKNA